MYTQLSYAIQRYLTSLNRKYGSGIFPFLYKAVWTFPGTVPGTEMLLFAFEIIQVPPRLTSIILQCIRMRLQSVIAILNTNTFPISVIAILIASINISLIGDW